MRHADGYTPPRRVYWSQLVPITLLIASALLAAGLLAAVVRLVVSIWK